MGWELPNNPPNKPEDDEDEDEGVGVGYGLLKEGCWAADPPLPKNPPDGFPLLGDVFPPKKLSNNPPDELDDGCDGWLPPNNPPLPNNPPELDGCWLPPKRLLSPDDPEPPVRPASCPSSPRS